MDDFDPSRAIDMTQEEFNPDRAVPVESTVGSDATQALNDIRSAKAPFSPETDFKLNLLAQQGKPYEQRFGEKAAGAITGAPGAIQDTGSALSDWWTRFSTEHANRSALENYTSLPSDALKLGVGVVKGAARLIPSAVDIAGSTVFAQPELAALAHQFPEASQKAQAMLSTLGDAANHYFNKYADPVIQAGGVDPNTPEVQLGEQLGPLAVPVGGEVGAGQSIARGAEAAVNKGVGTAAKLVGGTAKVASKVAPIGVAAGEAAAGLLAGHAIGHDLIGLLGAIGTGEVGGIRNKLAQLIQYPLEHVAELGDTLANLPEGATITEGLQSAARDKITHLQEQLADLEKSYGADKIADANKLRSGTSTYLWDDGQLGPQAAEYRGIQRSITDQLNKINTLEHFKNINRIFSDAAKYGIASGANTALAGGTMAALAGASSPPGDTEAPARGLVTGLAIGGATAPFAARSGFLGLAENDLINAGKGQIDPAHPDFAAHEKAMSRLDLNKAQGAMDEMNKYAGLVKPLGTKVVALTPEDMNAKLSGEPRLPTSIEAPMGPPTDMPPTQGQQAVNGFYDEHSNTVYVNIDALNSGTLGHEITHALDRAIGENTIGRQIESAIQSPRPEDRAKVGQFIDSYTEAMRRSYPEWDGMDPQLQKSELMAELGRDIMSHLGPEQLYGGKGGLTIMKEGVTNLLGKWNKGLEEFPGPFRAFEAPGTRQTLTDFLYQLGGSAKKGEQFKFPQNAPDLPEVPGQPTAQQNDSTGIPGGQTGVQTNISEAVAAMQALGIDKKTAQERVSGALDELHQENSPVTTEELVKRAAQRNVPKMPNTYNDPIRSRAMQMDDGMILQGATHEAIRNEGEKLGLDPSQLHAAKEGYVTRSGQFLTDEDNIGRLSEAGEPRGLLYSGDMEHLHLFNDTHTGSTIAVPKGSDVTDLITKHDLSRKRFMPSSDVPDRFYPDANGFIFDRLTGKDVDLFGPDDPQGHDSAQELADSYNQDNYPLPPGWTGSHPDAWIPEWGVDKYPGKDTWGISGEPKSQGMRDPDVRQLYGEFPTREAAEAARQQALHDLYNPAPQRALPDRALVNLGNGLTPEEDARYKEIRSKPSPTSEEADEFSRLTDKIDQHMESERKIQPQFMPSTDKSIEAVVRDYAKNAGLNYVPHEGYHPLNEDYSKAMADQYGRQSHDPTNPAVQKAYDAFRDGVMGQYQSLLAHGYKIEPWPNEGQPYANSAEMLKDLRDNKHLYYFETDRGYGEKNGSMGLDHPMLRGSGVFFNGKEAVINDIFRGVHDAIGHGMKGYQFGPRGEYNAFLEHKSTLPPESHQALATETLGQNSWTNFGPHMRDAEGNLLKPGDEGYLPITERPYTEQRANLLNFMPITADEVQGTNSRPVSQDEFDTLSRAGKARLNDFKKAAAPPTGLDAHWDTIKDQAWTEAQKDWGGIAIDSHTGQSLVGPIGQGGDIGKGPFGVTAKEEGQKTIEIPENASRAEFDKALERARKEFPQLAYQNYHLSVFHDSGKGTIDIDPTVIVDNAQDAEAIGAHTHAIGGIYDFDSGNGLYPPHVQPTDQAIDRPAIQRISDGTVFPAKSTPFHWMIPHEYPQELSDAFSADAHNKYVDGWVDRQGNFLDKDAAFQRAKEIGQLPENSPTEYSGSLSSLDFKQRQFMPSTGPVEAAKDLARAAEKVSTNNEEEFFGKIWPNLLRKTGLQVHPADKNIPVAAGRAVADMGEWLKDNPHYSDYYKNDKLVSEAHLADYLGRELTPDEKSMFWMAEGLTSPSTGLQANTGDALNIFNQWVNDGNLDSIKMGVSDKGNRVIAEAPFQISGTTNNLKAFMLKGVDQLAQKMGGMENAANYLQQEVSRSELESFNKEFGYKGGVGQIGGIKDVVRAATGQDEQIPRMFIFGKKVGAYTLNMLGDHRYNTVDVWESRFVRSYFKGLLHERFGIARSADEHQLFSKFSEEFNKQYRDTIDPNAQSSAMQAARWFYIIDAAKQAGYTRALTNETISSYLNQKIQGLRAENQTGGRKGYVRSSGLSQSTIPDSDPFSGLPER